MSFISLFIIRKMKLLEKIDGNTCSEKNRHFLNFNGVLMKDRLIVCSAENMLYEWIGIPHRVLSKNQFFSHLLTQKKKHNFILKIDHKGIICISPAKQEISVLLILKENASNFVKIIWWLYRPKWARSEAPVRVSGVGRSQHPIAMISGSLTCDSEIRSEVIRFKFGKSLWRCN